MPLAGEEAGLADVACSFQMYCGGVVPGKGVGGVGDNVHDALLSLFAEMESSELCRKLGVRFSGVGGAKIKTVLTRSTDGLAPTASAGTPRAAHGTPSQPARDSARHLATASNVPPHASPAYQPRSTPSHPKKNMPPPPTPSTPLIPESEAPVYTVRTRHELASPLLTCVRTFCAQTESWCVAMRCSDAADCDAP